ncbi:hypothetical protein BDY24DRAFT_388420 [Mrakia frigida]|uniref:Vps68p n=1 Tax=Mrakia frigida TaxID=29902 RepID=UPI003FCC0709
MSLPRAAYDPRRVFLFDFPKLSLGPKKREIGVYLSGAFFAIGWWVFIDAVILSKTAKLGPDSPYDEVPVHITFADWISGIIATLGMLITNMIDKSRLSADGGGAWGGEGTSAFRARLVLFLGFALMAGGLAGSLTTLIIKYILPSYPSEFVYYGIAAVAQAGGIMLSSVTLWGAQIAGESEYEYNINL